MKPENSLSVKSGGDSGKIGSLLLRAFIPGSYGAMIIAGVFAPSETGSSNYVPLFLLAGFILYLSLRTYSLLKSEMVRPFEKIELGLLSFLALSIVVETISLSNHWSIVLFSSLLAALSFSVPFQALVCLPAAAIALWLPLNEFPQSLAALELVASACAMVAFLEAKRRGRLETELQKLQLNVQYTEAKANGDMSTLDDILFEYLKEVKESTDAHGAVLAAKTPSGRLFIREMASDSTNIREEAAVDLDGTAFQWIVRNKKSLIQGNIKSPETRLGYYGQSVEIQSFMGIPLHDGDCIDGVLAVDSLKPDAFNEAHMTLLKVASRQMSTVLAQIRALDVAKKEARDFKYLHELSRRLVSARGVSEVVDGIISCARQRIQPDFAAVALLSSEKELRVEAVGESEWAAISGKTFELDGLAGWVMENGRYLHYEKGRKRSERPIFAKEESLPHFNSLLIVPLEARERICGVLCLGSIANKAFDQSTIAFCEVLAQQGAQGILQIGTMEQLKALATTDGLTGLANRRVFYECLEKEISRSRRYELDLSLLILDIDYFKQINDKYGHRAGDAVLERIADALVSLARETDLVARYGGEEFAVILPNSGRGEAITVAERIRMGVRSLEIIYEGKTIPIRLSIGAAMLKDKESADSQSLVVMADQALYAAKRSGRDRVVAYADLDGRTKSLPPSKAGELNLKTSRG